MSEQMRMANGDQRLEDEMMMCSTGYVRPRMGNFRKTGNIIFFIKTTGLTDLDFENEKFQTEPILKLKFNENRKFQNFLFSLNNENGT